MSKHSTSLTIEVDLDRAYESALRCLAEQEYRLVKDGRPMHLEMERGNPWYSTLFLTPGIAKSWKDHYCHVTASLMEEVPGRVRIDFIFNWRYSMMRPMIMELVDQEIAGIGARAPDSYHVPVRDGPISLPE